MIDYIAFILSFIVFTRCYEEDMQKCVNWTCQEYEYESWCKGHPPLDSKNQVEMAQWRCACEKCINITMFSGLQGKHKFSFQVTLNQFSTMGEDDFQQYYLNYPIDLVNNWQECRKDILSINDEIPDSVNWHAEGAVTPVNDQDDHCVSNWAFSAVGVMEAHRVIKFNETLVPLSAQNLIDCSNKFGNDGCRGGDVVDAFKYVKEKGINTDSYYPYVGQGLGKCRFEKNNSVGNLANDFRCVPEGDEEQLKAVVAKYGPVAVSVDGGRWDFRFYDSGIYHDDECCNHKRCLNHVMLVVGYGTEDGADYWLLKNSWGKSWGEQGYMRMARNFNNTCGIATAGLYLV